MQLLRRVANRIRHTFVKIKIRRNEREFCLAGHTLKYYYAPCKGAEVLAVVFSGFPAPGKPAAYNMVASFSGLKMNRLFILDDFGYQGRGAYYMSEQGDFYVRDMVLALLEQFPAKKRVFLGSSKGGTAALYFGVLAGADLVIAGAPQLYLGDYLLSVEKNIPVLDAMAGDHSPASVRKYNRVLPDVIEAGVNRQKVNVLLHYSKKEHTYAPHIAPMIALLEKQGYTLEHDVEDYPNHNDVARFFPALCKKKLEAIIAGEKK